MVVIPRLDAQVSKAVISSEEWTASGHAEGLEEESRQYLYYGSPFAAHVWWWDGRDG